MQAIQQSAITRESIAGDEVLPATLEPEAVERIAATLMASKSTSTRRAYKTAWASWARWAEDNDLPALPATPGAVVGYLDYRAEQGKERAKRARAKGREPRSYTSTLNMAISALSAVHELAAVKRPWIRSPCKSRLVREAIAGHARLAAQNGLSARQATALTAERVMAIRGSLNGRIETSAATATTMAIVSVLSVSGLRISEASRLRWADISEESDGSGRIAIAWSKADQHGSGAVVAITRTAMRDLARVRILQAERAGRDAGDLDPVFASWSRKHDRWTALSPGQLSRRIRAAAKGAGLEGSYSGHSPRVGACQTMTRMGASIQSCQVALRWASPSQVARYTRALSAAESLKYFPEGM